MIAPKKDPVDPVQYQTAAAASFGIVAQVARLLERAASKGQHWFHEVRYGQDSSGMKSDGSCLLTLQIQAEGVPVQEASGPAAPVIMRHASLNQHLKDAALMLLVDGDGQGWLTIQSDGIWWGKPHPQRPEHVTATLDLGSLQALHKGLTDVLAWTGQQDGPKDYRLIIDAQGKLTVATSLEKSLR